MRRVLGSFGLVVTFGVEPSTAALDERLAQGTDAIGLDAWLMAHRVVWPALAAGVPMVVGGEFAAGLQGVPIEDPEILVVQELPVARVVSVERQFVEDRTPIDVPVVPLVALQESGILGSAAAALAGRLLQRAIGSGR